MTRRAALALTALLLAIPACSDDDDDSDTVTAGTDPTTSTTEPSSTTEGGSVTTTTTIVEGAEALEPIDVSGLASDPSWAPRPDDPAAIAEFNTYVARGPKPYADSPLDLAAVFLGLEEPEEGGRIEAAVEGDQVTILEANIPDDSIADQLSILVFEPADGGIFRLVDVTRQVSCRPGRGHDDFSTEPCT